MSHQTFRCRPLCSAVTTLACVAFASLSRGTAVASPLDDYAALEIQMEVAEEEFYDNLEDTGKPNAPDQRPAILARMDKLVEASTGKPEGGTIATNTFLWAMGIAPESAFKRFKTLVRDFKDSPNLGDTFDMIPHVYEISSTPAAWIKELDKLAAASRETSVQAGANFVVGKIRLNENEPGSAKKAFEKARQLEPDSVYAATAKGYIFEIEHLQVGMIAPDFKIKTLEGNETSLTSLRGKAVLLNFWASW